MLQEIVIPKMGQTVEEATIEKWLKSEGDSVSKGEPVFEITTDKATLEVESFVSGALKKIILEPGEVVPIGAIAAFVGDEADEVTQEMVAKARSDMETLRSQQAAAKPKEEAVAQQAAPREAPAPEPAVSIAPPPVALAPGRLFASPRARRVAQDRKVSLNVLTGSGPNGRVVERDVQSYLERLTGLKISPTARALAYERDVDLARVRGSGPAGKIMKADVAAAPSVAGPPGGRLEPASPMRKIIADRMTYSKKEIPHFYLCVDVDATEMVAFRAQYNAESGSKVSYNDILIAACAKAFQEVPEMNVFWHENAIFHRDRVNIGLAVALDGGLIVPVVRDADRKTIPEISTDTQDLIAKAQGKRLQPDEYQGGCLTISNLGMFGIDSFIPIINPGEAAILGVGRIAEKPVVIDGGIAVRKMMNLTLSCDHRAGDGATAARFLQVVQNTLEDPQALQGLT